MKIANASVWGITSSGEQANPCATGYAYRSHSGYFGIVNSEEAYQNLTRFLFGDVRVDIWVDVESVTLPAALQDKEERINALYQFEILASPRGKRWYLTRRISEEDSVACRTHKELTSRASAKRRNIFLSTAFLSKAARVDPSKEELSYIVTLGVRVPDYEIDRKLWLDEHFEGGYLFRDELHVVVAPPSPQANGWKVESGWKSDSKPRTETIVGAAQLTNRAFEIKVPFSSNRAPGITGSLRLVISEWNVETSLPDELVVQPDK